MKQVTHHLCRASSIALSVLATLTPAQSQIVPDNTLPVNSQVTGCPVCLIEGGTVRGVNLFHSFEEFSVQTGGEAFFNNGLQIENILGRVTGVNISDIDGLIRANGVANLFLINPNGIVFGENARLDVGSSFVASTANSFTFPDGSEFSATNPQVPPLLTINVTPGLQYGTNSPGGTIANAGSLMAGQDLMLAADNLELQGELSAGKDLTLQAQDTVRIRDSVAHPFIASAQGNLLVTGNQGIDIFALNHTDSGLFSGGDMVLRSAADVGGDAHYWSGGSFRIEQLDGNLGGLLSPGDPIIRALGDVSVNSYTGASLHILAGGGVNIGTVTITGADPTEGIRENVTLSDGTVVVIDGQQQPTLDVRAGLEPNAVGSPIGLTGNNFFDSDENFDGIPESANITVGSVFVDAPNGVVFLTNQYQPNRSLSGDIEIGSIFTDDFVFTGNAGSVVIDSRGNINITNQMNSSSASGDAGDITLIADDIVSLRNDFIFSATLGTGAGGDIRIQSGSVLLTQGVQVITGTFGTGNAGNLTVETGQLLVQDGSQMNVSTFGIGDGGELNVNATEIELIGTNPINGRPSGLFADVAPNARGNAGDVTILTQGLHIIDGAEVSASTFGKGNAGELRVVATDRIEVIGSDPQGNPSDIAAQVNPYATGKGGNITLETGELVVSQGGQIRASTFGMGDGGELKVYATEIKLVGTNPIDSSPSGLFAAVAANATGNGGNLTIETQGLRLVDDADVSTSTSGKGNAGDLRVVATDRIEVIRSTSSITAQVNPGATGNGGNLTLETGELLVSQGGQIGVATLGIGDGGELNVNATEIKLIGTNPIIGNPSGLFADVAANATGNGGDMTISTQVLRVMDGAVVSASTLGKGDAGDLQAIATDRIEVIGSEPSLIITQVNPNATGKGGNLTLETGELVVSQGSQIGVATFGAGDGGELNVNATEIKLIGTNPIIGNPSGLFANVAANATGNGGNMTIETQGLRIIDGASLSATTLGRGNGGELRVVATDRIEVIGSDPQGASSSIDAIVTASAEGNGGNLNLSAPSIILADKGVLSMETRGDGAAGNLTIETQRLTVTDDASVSTSTSSPNPEGIGGNLTINARESLQLMNQGRVIAQSTGAAAAGDVTINTPLLNLENDAQILASNVSSSSKGIILEGLDTLRVGNNSEISASTQIGQAGNLRINPHSNPANLVQVSNNSRLSVEATQGGRAGNLTIRANSLFLDQGQVTAATGTSGIEEGANISLQELNTLFMTNESRISAQASGDANGGNIDIDSTYLIVLPPQGANGSDIIASASRGNGGQITITGEGIFGIEERPAIDGNRTNDIDASSQFGAPGEVQLNVSLDPARGLVELPGELVDVSRLVEQNLCQAAQGSSFTVTGRGGLPTPPHEPLQAEATWEDWRIASESEFTTNTTGAVETRHGASGEAGQRTHHQTQDSKPKQIIEAQGWYRDANGNVVLTAYPTTVTPHGTWLNSTNCQ